MPTLDEPLPIVALVPTLILPPVSISSVPLPLKPIARFPLTMVQLEALPLMVTVPTAEVDSPMDPRPVLVTVPPSVMLIVPTPVLPI